MGDILHLTALALILPKRKSGWCATFFPELKQKESENEKTNIRTSVIAGIGSVIGLKSGLFGIGGGAISVPFLNNAGLSMKKATGTSSAFTLPISIVGSICFIYIGIMHHRHIAHTIGYTHWPATLIIVPCTMFFAPIGCTLSNRMSTKWLRILFMLFLLFVSSKMLITSLWKI